MPYDKVLDNVDMQEYIERFYSGKAWRVCRDGFLKSKFHKCERCGKKAKLAHHREYLTSDNVNDPYKALCFDNLEALCQDCHNTEHHRGTAELRYEFDDKGNLMKKK